MKICEFLFVSIAINLVCAAPAFDDVTVDSSENEISKDSYKFSYTQSDGQTREESGILKTYGSAEVYEVSGSYGFQGTDGKNYVVKYTSGVDGYKAIVSAVQVASYLSPTFVNTIDPSLLKTLVG